MIKGVDILPGKKRQLSDVELDMIEAAKKREPHFDDDSPKMDEMMKKAFMESVKKRNRRKA